MQRPNLLLILTDQQSFDTLSLHNPASPVQTPHLDRLTDNSIRFTQAAAVYGEIPKSHGPMLRRDPAHSETLQTLRQALHQHCSETNDFFSLISV